jgi:hypothetical protein
MEDDISKCSRLHDPTTPPDAPLPAYLIEAKALGGTGRRRHYRHRGGDTPGDLLIDALGMDFGAEGLNALSDEIELLGLAVRHGEFGGLDDEIAETAFAAIVGRARVLGEVSVRQRQALVDRIAELEEGQPSTVDSSKPKPEPAKAPPAVDPTAQEELTPVQRLSGSVHSIANDMGEPLDECEMATVIIESKAANTMTKAAVRALKGALVELRTQRAWLLAEVQEGVL